MKNVKTAALSIALLLISTIYASAVDAPNGSFGSNASTQPKLLSGSGRLIRPSDAIPVDDAETKQLDALFATASKDSAAFPPGTEHGAARRAVDNDLRDKVKSFLAGHTNSAWAPGLHIYIARGSKLRSSYMEAMDHYRQTWTAVKGSTNRADWLMGHEAVGNLGKLLVLTGRTDEFDALEKEANQLLKGGLGDSEWAWATEMRAWVNKYPSESYKCGLYCLDQLGRLTQSGQFLPKDILETESSTNGFTIADLVRLGTKAGLHIHAALLSPVEFTNLPVPAVVHLRSDHFVVVRHKQGDFYNVYHPVAYGVKWLTASEIAQEATGAVLVSDVSPSPAFALLTTLDPIAAAAYRGRCHAPLPSDHGDNGGCSNQPCTSCPCPTCPPGPSPGPGPSVGPGPGAGAGAGAGPRPPSCAGCKGMPTFSVSEPYLTPWVQDIPLQYEPAYGPAVTLRLAYTSRNQASYISGNYCHGAQMGNVPGFGLWSCSWFSYVELDSGGDSAELMLPGGGWATFTFPSGSLISSVNYMHNTWLEQVVISGSVTSLILHNQDGSESTYGVLDNSNPYYGGLFYISSEADISGAQTTYAYDSNFYLTNVTAADGTAFTLHYANPFAQYVTSVSSSYGVSVSLTYDAGRNGTLSGITDAAGISSQFSYFNSFGCLLTQLTTPYGTTLFNTAGDLSGNFGVFDRMLQITNADNSVEFYGLINSYGGTDWPDFVAGQIPTGTPTGTLDAEPTERQERNTFHWNAQQFAPYLSTSFSDFNWSMFKQARIHHWLADTDTSGYTHFNSLSVEQAPSPDGTTEGQLTWYDYTNKPPGVDHEVGAQIMASDIAKVLPDGTTWYQHFAFTTNGLPKQQIEKWVAGGINQYRTNTYVYAANGIDLVAITNALGIQITSNVYNAFHQVATHYDALNQATTNTYDATTLKLTSIRRPTGLITTNVYDGAHRLRLVIDLQINRTNSYTWNADGTVHSQTNELGLTITNFWDGLHRLTGVLYPDGTTTSNLYYRVDNTAYPSSTGNTNILDLTASRDRLGYWTYFNYDSLRRKISMTNANQVVTGYGYCNCGALTYVTNALGTAVQSVTQYVYDYQSRLIETFLPEGTIITGTYDNLGRVAVVSDAFGNRTNNYDNLGRLTTISNYFGRVQASAYDILDRNTNSVDGNGVTITNSYDNLDRMIVRAYPDGGAELFAYSPKGLALYSNQLGKATSYGYDAASRKIAETNANHEATYYVYDAATDLLSLTDGKGQVTAWNYNVFGLVSNKVDATPLTVLVYQYDADNRLTNRWSAAKQNTSYAYDCVGNLTNISYNLSHPISLAYDALNRPFNMIDGVGTTSYGYDAASQLLSEDGPWPNDTVTYSYTSRMRTSLSLQQPDADPWAQTYSYDGARRLTSTVSPAGTFGYAYDAIDQLQVRKLALPNGAYITNTFDSVGRLSSTILYNSGNTNLDGYLYSYNVGNQRALVYRPNPESLINYTYDNIGQLQTAIGKQITSLRLNEQFGYGYDAAHNLSVRTNNALVQTFGVNNVNELSTITRNSTNALTVEGTTGSAATSVTVNGVSASLYWDNTFAATNFTPADGNNTYTAIAHDSLGRYSTNSITTYLPASASYTYDLNGNLLSDGIRYFAYDDENELTSVTVSNAWQSVFVYDGKLRRRIRKELTWQSGAWIETNEVRYVYDGNVVLQEREVNNLPVTSYTRGNDLSGSLQGAGGIGGMLSLSQPSTVNPLHYYYHADGNGNITAMINGLQFIAAKYLYDPFGNILSQSGPMAAANLYRLSSKEFHQNSGLVYYLYRFYDPNLQRWPNRDPLEELGFETVRLFKTVKLVSVAELWQRQNLFEYEGNDPQDKVDSLGLYTWGPGYGTPGIPDGCPGPKPKNCSKSACEKAAKLLAASGVVGCAAGCLLAEEGWKPCDSACTKAVGIAAAALYLACQGCQDP